MQNLLRLSAVALVLVLAGALTTCALDTRRTPIDDSPPLLLISIDGFRHDYLELTELPALERLAREGLKADSLMHIFPTKTFATHYALVTGLYAESTGVVANNMWDPQRRSTFSLGNREAVGDGYWYDGEPIWNTVEKAGRIASPNTWPGGAAQIGGMRPTIVRQYDGSISHDDRVDQVLDWLDLPADQRPAFMTLYFSAVDSAGHRHGPGHPNVIEAMREVDRAIGRLIDGLEQRERLGDTHVLVTSDHGMTGIALERYLLLDDYLDLSRVRVSDWGPAAQIWTMDGGPSAEEILAAVDDIPNSKAWLKGDGPERYRFDEHKRVPDVTVEADLGWMISNQPHFAGMQFSRLSGMHGWDPAWHDMHGIFIAHGPAFAAGSRLPAVRSVDLYSLMAELLNVPPAPTSGSLTAFAPALNSATPSRVDTTLWDCPGRRFEVRIAPGVASVQSAGRVFALPAAVAASGAKYQDATTVFWTHGDRARFEIDGRNLERVRSRPALKNRQAAASAGGRRSQRIDRGESVVEHEGHFQGDAEFLDLAVVAAFDLLALDPGALDVLQGLVGAGDAVFDGIFETAAGGCDDFRYTCNGHKRLLNVG
jgi:predicted AlkP superfamily pyrophosphatase or phosphodiesterase